MWNETTTTLKFNILWNSKVCPDQQASKWFLYSPVSVLASKEASSRDTHITSSPAKSKTFVIVTFPPFPVPSTSCVFLALPPFEGFTYELWQKKKTKNYNSNLKRKEKKTYLHKLNQTVFSYSFTDHKNLNSGKSSHKDVLEKKNYF